MFDSKDEGLEFVGKMMEAFPEYVNTVVTYQTQIPIVRMRYEGEDLMERIMAIDRQRHNAHESAISSVNILNRVCEKMGLEPFTAVDTTNRTAVADFVGQFVNETYNGGIGGTMDEIAHQHAARYEPKAHTERLNALTHELGLGDDGTPSEDFQP